MILSTVSLKGGSGKTTIAINLAVALAHKNLKVILVDSDPLNKSCVKWSGLRDSNLPKITTVGLGDPKGLKKNIDELEKLYDYVIIDGTPALAELTGIIMLVSDFVLLPLKASCFDIWAFNDEFLPTFNKIRMLKPELDCRIILNDVQGNTKINREAIEVLEEYDIKSLKSTVGSRTIYKYCPQNGIGVIESTSKIATREIKQLADETIKILTAKMQLV